MILFFRQSLFVLFVVVFVSGCGILAGVYEAPYVDAVKNKDGSITVLDTPRMWNMWVAKIDDDIRYEVSGRKPFIFGDGLNAWRDTWEYALITPLKDQENRGKYKDYLVISRRVAGLPELDVRIDLSEY